MLVWSTLGVMLLLFMQQLRCAETQGCPTDKPPVWPLRFKVLQRRVPDDDPDCSKGSCANVTTYYDWEKQGNLIIDVPDSASASGPMHDLELGNRHSYYFYPVVKQCNFMEFPVGILRRDWLKDATFMGKSEVRGRAVIGWTKVDFIDYYVDPDDCSPVSWHFHTMKTSFHTQQWSEGEAVPDASFFEPPEYCPNRTSSQTVQLEDESSSQVALPTLTV
mmetsp:Transcript_67392/g.161632  ORF Transcript_67392/g.161632 Transcript_67392/m.161632 type:complete len:219 (+) Transcript_67392:71-727(+)